MHGGVALRDQPAPERDLANAIGIDPAAVVFDLDLQAIAGDGRCQGQATSSFLASVQSLRRRFDAVVNRVAYQLSEHTAELL